MSITRKAEIYQRVIQLTMNDSTPCHSWARATTSLSDGCTIKNDRFLSRGWHKLKLAALVDSNLQTLDTIIQRLEGHGIELSYFKIALKALGIGYVTSLSADICRDAGQTTLATLSEIVGKCGIFILSLPLVINIIDLALGFIK